MILKKIIIFFLGLGFGFLVIYYNRWFANIVGRSAWAERVFGGAGTYTMWKLIGLLIMVLTVLYVFGALEGIMDLSGIIN